MAAPHGDDRIGWWIINQLSDESAHGDALLRKAKSPIDILHWLPERPSTSNRIERLIVCDACSGIGPVATINHWIWPTPKLTELRWSGTHDLSLVDVLTLARTLQRLPEHVEIWGIEGQFGPASPSSLDTEPAAPLSHAIRDVTRQIIAACNPN